MKNKPGIISGIHDDSYSAIVLFIELYVFHKWSQRFIEMLFMHFSYQQMSDCDYFSQFVPESVVINVKVLGVPHAER